MATGRSVVTTSCRKVCSTIGSPRVSLGSGIVTIPGAAAVCTSVVRLSSRGVRSSIGTVHEEHCLRVEIVPLWLLIPVVLIAPCLPASRVLSPLPASCCNPQTVYSTYFYLLQFSARSFSFVPVRLSSGSDISLLHSPGLLLLLSPVSKAQLLLVMS